MFSACLIVKNEEKNIETCLSSIHPIVDEIIVVDTGSTDNTLNIVKTFAKANVFHYEWTDHFANARNFSLEQAAGDWLLIVDADEYISYNDYEKILRALDKPGIDGYYMLTHNYTRDYTRVDFVAADGQTEARDFPGWTPSHKTRILRNRKEFRFMGRIHEVIDQSILNHNGTIEILDVPIHHYGQDSMTIDKVNLYKRLAVKKMDDDPKNPMVYYELGQVQITNGDIDQGIETFKKGIAIKPDFGDFRYGNFHHELGNIYYQMKNDLDEALKHYLEAIRVRPGYMYSYSMVGAIYRKKKQYNIAKVYLEEAILLDAATPNTYCDLGWIYFQSQDYPKAIDCFAKAIEMAPQYVSPYNNIAVSHHLNGNPNEAERFWNLGLKIDPEYGDILENMKRFEASKWPVAEEGAKDSR